MTLQWQTVELPLGGSLDQSKHPFVLPVPLLTELQNARVFKDGSVGKRHGWIDVAATGVFERVLTAGDQIFTLRPKNSVGTVAPITLGALNFDDQRIDYYGGKDGSYSISEVEVIARETIARDMLSDSLGTQFTTNPDFEICVIEGLALIAWEAYSAPGSQRVIFCKAIDINTRKTVFGPAQVSTSTGIAPNTVPRVIKADATTLVVVYARAGGTNQLRARPFDCTTRTLGTDTVLRTDIFEGFGPRFDACALTGATSGWYILYQDVTFTWRILKMDLLTILQNTTVGENDVQGIGGLAIYADNATSKLWLSWYDTTRGLRACIRDTTTITTTVLSNTTMEVVTDTAKQITWAPGNPAANEYILCWTTDGLATDPGGYGRKVTKFRTLTTAGVKGSQAAMADVVLLSKAFPSPNGYTYAAVLYDASGSINTVTGQRSFANQVAFTLQICHTINAPTVVLTAPKNSFRVAATWAIGEAGWQRSESSLSHFRELTVNGLTEQWWALSPEFDAVQSTTLATIIGEIVGIPGVDLCRQRIDDIPPIYATKIGNNVVFSGGVPQVWDGSTLNEYGFLTPAENGKGVDGGVSSLPAALTLGTYGVRLVWEYRLATGDIVQSQTSEVRTSTTSTGIIVTTVKGKIAVTVPSLHLTRKVVDGLPTPSSPDVAGVVCRAYRTEVGQTTYYRDGEIGGDGGFSANKQSNTAPLTITVEMPDTSAIVHPKIYTDGGLLDNFPPPALAFVHTHRNRLFGIVAENRRQVVFTHEYIVGELPGWHPNLVIDVPDEAVALATVDEKLIIFCRGGIFLIAGNGPDRKGLNSDYDQPFRLNTPHGCKTAQSVVSFPDGIIYQAPTGFCLIDRKTNVTRIGGPVEDTTIAYPWCVDAVVNEQWEWIYFSMANHPRVGEATGGRTIVYDWGSNVWSVDVVGLPGELGAGTTFHTSLATAGGAIYSTVSGGFFVYVEGGSADPGGGVLPDGQFIPMRIKTGMLHLGSIHKFQRARWLTLMGKRNGTHALGVTVDTFHHATSAPLSQSFTWTNAQITAMQDYALKMHIRHQKGAFYQITIADGPDVSAPTLASDSVTLVGIALEMGLKGRMENAQAAVE